MRTLRWAPIWVLVPLLLGACSSDDDAASSSITATATDFMFSPDAWAVNADEDFDVTLNNEGSVEHEWAVLKEGVEISSEAEFSEDVVEFEIEAIDPDTSTTQTFTLPAGTYQVICAIETHFDLGMEGALTVG